MKRKDLRSLIKFCRDKKDFSYLQLELRNQIVKRASAESTIIQITEQLICDLCRIKLNQEKILN